MTQMSVAPQQLPVIAAAPASALPDAVADSAAEAGADFASVLRAQIATPANAAPEAEIFAARLPPGAAEAAEEVPADDASAPLAPDLASLLPILAGLLPATQKAAPAEPQARLAGVAAGQPLPAAAEAGTVEAPLNAAPPPQAADAPRSQPLPATAEAGTVEAPLNATPPPQAAGATRSQPLPAAAAEAGTVQAPLYAAPPPQAAGATRSQPLPAAAAEAGTVQAPLNAAPPPQAANAPRSQPLPATAEAGTVQAPLNAAPLQQAAGAPRRSQPLPAATAEASAAPAPLNSSLSSTTNVVSSDDRAPLPSPTPPAGSADVSIRQAPAEALPAIHNSTVQQMPPAAEQVNPTTPAGQAAPAAFAHATSAYEAPDVVRIDTPVGNRGWDNEMAQKVVMLVGRQESRAELTLTPPQLGRVDVTISVQGDQTSAAFVSASPAAREALEQALPRLREILAEAGITLGQASVNAESPRQGRDDPPAPARGDSPGMDAARDSDAPVQWARRSNGLIDTFA